MTVIKLDKKQISAIREDATINATMTIARAVERHGLLNHVVKSILLLQIMEAMCCGIVIPGLRALGGLNPGPEEDLDPTRDDNRLAALLMHNLILRRDGTSIRATIEQTINEYSARYNTESPLGSLIFEEMKKWSK